MSYVTSDPSTSLLYAQFVTKGRFPEGEAAIAKDSQDSLTYADRVIKEPFPEGEAVIAKSYSASIPYAVFVLKNRFLAGEKHHKDNKQWWKEYKMDMNDFLDIEL